MGFLAKLLLANLLIVTSVLAGRRAPSLAGLLATMPLTTLVVLVWLWSDVPGDYGRAESYVRGVLWGIVPSALFYLAALWAMQRQLPFPAILAASFGVWLAGAAVHRWLLP